MNAHRNDGSAFSSRSALTAELLRLLTPERLGIIHRHARAAYPRECCGMVLASGVVRTCENAQDKLHSIDPESFPRTSANAYCFDVDDQLFLARSLESDDPVRIVYHSHPDTAPDFSETDRRGATFEGQALYPEMGYFVVQSGPERSGPSSLYIYYGHGFQQAASWAEEML